MAKKGFHGVEECNEYREGNYLSVRLSIDCLSVSEYQMNCFIKFWQYKLLLAFISYELAATSLCQTFLFSLTF